MLLKRTEFWPGWDLSPGLWVHARHLPSHCSARTPPSSNRQRQMRRTAQSLPVSSRLFIPSFLLTSLEERGTVLPHSPSVPGSLFTATLQPKCFSSSLPSSPWPVVAASAFPPWLSLFCSSENRHIHVTTDRPAQKSFFLPSSAFTLMFAVSLKSCLLCPLSAWKRNFFSIPALLSLLQNNMKKGGWSWEEHVSPMWKHAEPKQM